MKIGTRSCDKWVVNYQTQGLIPMSQEKKRRPQILLRSYEHSDRWGDVYEDCIYLRNIGDGSLNLIAIKYFQGQKHLLEVAVGIRTFKRFDSVFGRIIGVAKNDGYTDELFNQVAKLAPVLGEKLWAKFSAEEDGDEGEEGRDESGPKKYDLRQLNNNRNFRAKLLFTG